MMTISALDSIDRNMDQQLRVLKELLGAVDECEKNNCLEDISETELQDMALAANTAKKMAKNLRPLAEAEDKAKKAEEKKKKAEAKKTETAAKKKAAEKPAEQGNSPEVTEEEDLSFLD